MNFIIVEIGKKFCLSFSEPVLEDLLYKRFKNRCKLNYEF